MGDMHFIYGLAIGNRLEARSIYAERYRNRILLDRTHLFTYSLMAFSQSGVEDLGQCTTQQNRRGNFE